MNAFSSAIQQALVSLSADPLLLWNYGFVAILAFVGGNLFWLINRKLDKEEESLNRIQASTYSGRGRNARGQTRVRIRRDSED